MTSNHNVSVYSFFLSFFIFFSPKKIIETKNYEHFHKIVQFKLYPIIQMIRRKTYFSENECNNTCHAFAQHANTKPTSEETETTLNDSNDFDSNNNNTNDDEYDNNDDSHTTHTNKLSNDVTDEMDNISLEILWEPQSNGKQITADIVFIHGLHGKQKYSIECVNGACETYGCMHTHYTHELSI